MSRADRVVGAALFVAALLLGTWYVPQVVAAGANRTSIRNSSVRR